MSLSLGQEEINSTEEGIKKKKEEKSPEEEKKKCFFREILFHRKV